jgi:hypothetical protein
MFDNAITSISAAVVKLSFAPLLIASALVYGGQIDQVVESFHHLANLGEILGK